jgi:hypothetical protein
LEKSSQQKMIDAKSTSEVGDRRRVLHVVEEGNERFTDGWAQQFRINVSEPSGGSNGDEDAKKEDKTECLQIEYSVHKFSYYSNHI